MPAKKKEVKIEMVPDTYKWLRDGSRVAWMDDNDRLEFCRSSSYDLEIIDVEDAKEMMTILTSYVGLMESRKDK
jgi:hypothetical protein